MLGAHILPTKTKDLMKQIQLWAEMEDIMMETTFY